MSEFGKLKLALFNDKMGSILKVSRREKEYDETYPISVELSLTNKCNLNCVWCCDSTIRKKYNGDLDKEILDKLFDDLRKGGTKGITVEGGGEPTIHPDFELIIDGIKRRKMAVGLFSNGVNVDKVLKNIDKFEWIRISLDADSKETYKKYKGYDGFDIVMDNIKRLVAKKNKTVIGVGYVATRYNLGNIEDVIESLKGIGVDYFYIRPVEDNPRFISKNNLNWLKEYETDEFKIVINYADRIIKGNANLPCICHSLVTVISADGSVYICGRLHINPSHTPIGNLKKNSFHEIWNSKRRIEMSKKLFNRELTGKICPVCRITKFNEFANEILNTKTVNFI